MIHLPWLGSSHRFPPVETALTEPDGLLAAGGDLAPERVLAAYRHGIFPWFGPGEPVLWWSPDPRLVLRPASLVISRSLDKVLRNRPYEVRFDTAFEAVMRACAAPRGEQGGTWISEDIIAAYVALHQQGYAHSVETWVNGQLAGGLYGVSVGRMFYGESMFSRVADGSKIALVHLCQVLQQHGYPLIDCQMQTAHLQRMGGETMARAEFCRQVSDLVQQTSIIKAWDFRFRSVAAA